MLSLVFLLKQELGDGLDICVLNLQVVKEKIENCKRKSHVTLWFGASQAKSPPCQVWRSQTLWSWRCDFDLSRDLTRPRH